MTAKDQASQDFLRVLDIVVRLVLLAALLIYSFQILQPFLLIIIWATILAVSSAPLCEKISKFLGNRPKMAAALTTALLLIVLLVPCLYLAGSLVTGVNLVSESWHQGKITIPPPTEQIKEFPIVGRKLFNYWSLAYSNIESFLEPYALHLQSVGRWVLTAAASTGIVMLQFIFSIIIAGVFLASREKCSNALKAIFSRLDSDRGIELLNDAAVTIQSVTRGVVGVAFIQAVLTGVGLAFAGITGAGLWALLALILGIIQVGVAPILLTAVIYLFSTASTLKASLFLVWALFVGPLDNILKPILLGRGAPVPMLVIFLGAIGGFIHSGLFGLFLGAIILSLAYKLLITWTHQAAKT